MDGVEEDAVGFVLEDVSASDSLDELVSEVVRLMHGEDQNFGGGRGFADVASGLDTVEERHADVEDGDVRLVLCGFIDGVAAVGGFGADLPTGARLKKSPETGANYRVIIGDQDGERGHRWNP